MAATRVDLSQYIVASIWWGCNNHCTICMLSGVPEKLRPIEYGDFKQLLMRIVDQARFRKLILSGAEVTTFKELDKYVRFAASLGWFEKIQIQTNGRRLRAPGPQNSCFRQQLHRIVTIGRPGKR